MLENSQKDLGQVIFIKIGIEIHQRLNTGKLFCRCPSNLTEEVKVDFEFYRFLHPVVSELGEVDEASKKEFEKNRKYKYQGFFENCCLVEADEEPPREMNKLALRVALQIAKSLNAQPVEVIQIMRKIVIDGSNTSGFQRTALIAYDGYVETSKGKVKIDTIALEEESAGIVERTTDSATYRLDRLGIPLIEISTAPEIKDGEHLRETAEKIGLLLRMSEYAARGLGTIRQDVNISIEGGARVEIKGAQDLKLLPKLVEFEVTRQRTLLEILSKIRDKLPIRPEIIEITEIFSNTSSKIIKRLKTVFAISLPEEFEGILGKEVCPGRRFGTELSDYAKLAGVKGIIHSDEDLTKYGFSDIEITALRQRLGKAFVLSLGNPRALERVIERINMDYVPKETRKANPDGTSSFMRPLPGRARMYPETDIPTITADFWNTLERLKSVEELEEELTSLVGKEMAKVLVKSKNLPLFKRLVAKKYEPKLVATILENTWVSLRREGINITPQMIEKTIELYSKELIVKSAIPEVLKAFAEGKKEEEILEMFKRFTREEILKIIEKEGKDLKKIMSKYRLRIEGKEVAKILHSV